MDKQGGVDILKNEFSNTTSTDQFHIPSEIQTENNKQKNNFSAKTEVCIKTEPYEVVTESLVVAGTSHDICSNDDIKFEISEPLIQIEYTDLKIEELEDPLHISNQIKVELEGNEDHLIFKSKDRLENKREESDKEEKPKSIYDADSETFANEESKSKNKQGQRIKKHSCHVCHKIFLMKSGLEMHLRIHTGEKPYECHICKKSFSVKSSLERHTQIHIDEKAHECDICKKVFRYQSNLNVHKLIHSSEKPYSCSECNKSFSHNVYLATHKRIHTGDKPYTCDLCDKAFAQKVHLIRHKLVHTKEKPYSCEICNKSFAHKSTLSQHSLTHTGEKPYSCNICNKSFARKEVLNYHTRTHKK